MRLMRLPSEKFVEMIQVEQEQAHQLFDAVGVPAAGDIFLAQPDIAARHDPAQHIPVVDLEAGAEGRDCAPVAMVTSPLGAMNSSVPYSRPLSALRQLFSM